MGYFWGIHGAFGMGSVTDAPYWQVWTPLVVAKYSRCQSHVMLLHRAQGTPVGKDHLGLGTMCFYSLNRVS